MSFEITAGITVDGVNWRWRDGYLPPTTLLLYPEVATPNDDDTWCIEESRKTLHIMEVLAVPRISVAQIAPRPLTPHRLWTAQDIAPRWVFNEISDYSFMYGIVRKLLESLDFDGLPPSCLLDAWDEFGEDIEDELHEERQYFEDEE